MPRPVSGATRGRFAPPRGSYGAIVYMPRARRAALVNDPSYLASRPLLRWHRCADMEFGCSCSREARAAVPAMARASLCCQIAAIMSVRNACGDDPHLVFGPRRPTPARVIFQLRRRGMAPPRGRASSRAIMMPPRGPVSHSKAR